MTKILLLLLLTLTEPLTAETIKTAQSIFIGKSKIGYLQTIREENNDTVTTTVKEYTSFKRGKYGEKMPTLTETRVQEKNNGELLSFISTYDANGLKRTYHGVAKSGILSIEEQSPLSSKKIVFPIGQDVFFYEGIRTHFESTKPVPGTSITYTTMNFSLMELHKVNRTVYDRELVETKTDGQQLYKIEYDIQSERGAITTISFVDELWHEKKVVQPVGAVQIVSFECPFDSAPSGISEYEILYSSAIDAPTHSSGFQFSASVNYELTIPANFELPLTDEQSIIAANGNTIQLNISKMYIPSDATYPVKDIPIDKKIYLQPSRYIESDDPQIKSMAMLAVRKTRRAKRAVNRIRRFVQFNITPSYSTIYATALETAQLNQGDCTEFALLTTALCRAANIPARVVNGIAYTSYGEKFFYHAWTQVFIEGKWYSVDAAMRVFDPGHIALSFSTDGAPDYKTTDCIGILKIKSIQVCDTCTMK